MSSPLSERLQRRLEALRAEYAAGATQKGALEDRLRHLNQTMMRISGAIQVIKGALAEEASKSD